jgi:hypothetical protein
MRPKLRSLLADSDDKSARGTGEGEEEVARRGLNKAARPGEASGEQFDGPADGEGRKRKPGQGRDSGEQAAEVGEGASPEPDPDHPKKRIGQREGGQLPGTEPEEADPGRSPDEEGQMLFLRKCGQGFGGVLRLK